MALDGALWLGRGQGQHSTRGRPPEQDPARGVGGARQAGQQAGQQAGCGQGQGLSPCAAPPSLLPVPGAAESKAPPVRGKAALCQGREGCAPPEAQKEASSATRNNNYVTQ